MTIKHFPFFICLTELLGPENCLSEMIRKETQGAWIVYIFIFLPNVSNTNACASPILIVKNTVLTLVYGDLSVLYHHIAMVNLQFCFKCTPNKLQHFFI